MMSIIAVFFVGLLIPMGAIDADSPSLSLATLCKGEKVHLRTLNQLDSLVEELRSFRGECSDTVKDALKDMKKLTDVTDEGVCTMDQAKAITDFVDKYLKDAPDGTKRGLPEPLEKFAIAYGMKVSGICSHRMVRELPFAMHLERTVSSPWRHHVAPFLNIVSNDGPIGAILDPIIKTGEAILPVDLLQVLPGMKKDLIRAVSSAAGAIRFKFLCERDLQPLYEPLVLPLAHLIRAGFNNREYYWAWKFHYRGRLWSRAVFLCEIAKMIEVERGQKAGVRDKKEEAAIVEAVESMKLGELTEAEVREESSTTRVAAKSRRTDETIYGRFDYSMKSLVKAFDANKDHVQLLRERILKRSFRVVRRLFKKEGFAGALRALKAQKGQEKQVEEAKEMLVELMESPNSNSAAYNWLIYVPKYLYDVSMLIICGVIVVVAFILFGWVTSPQEQWELGQALDSIYFNQLLARDTGIEHN